MGNGHLNVHPEFQLTKMNLKEALAGSPRAAAAIAWAASPEERSEIVRTLASETAMRSDAHLIKYVRACLDAAAQCESDERLFHAAAAYLCSIWCREQPREHVLRDFDRR
jgi:hypothetical protein